MGRPGPYRWSGEGVATPTRRVTLETQRLRLEPVSTSHAGGLHAAVVASRPELLLWMPWAREPSLEGSLAVTVRDEQAWRDDRVFHFALIDQESGDAIGVAGLNREGSDAAELHYWIRSDHAGRGLTTEACRALIDWARDELGVARLTLWAGKENHASRRVAAKLGFAHIGPLAWRPEGGIGTFAAESYELRLRPERPSPPAAE